MGYVDAERQRRYQREWIARRRASFFKDKSCAVCGSVDRLELDHKDPRLKVSHQIWSWSQARRDAEIAKCQVLCHGHHLIKTRADLADVYGLTEPPHGVNRYKSKKYRCRCQVCTAAQKESRRAERRNKPVVSNADP